MTTRLITQPFNLFEGPGAVFQTFDITTGVQIEITDCVNPPLDCPFEYFPFCQVTANGAIYGSGFPSAGIRGLIKFSNNLTFLSYTEMVPPAPDPGFDAMEPLADYTGHLFGVYQGLDPDAVNYDSLIVQIDPDTLVQTELWRNFQPPVGGIRQFIANTYAMSPAGDKFYYHTGDDILQLNIATGVTTVFATQIETGWFPQPVTHNTSTNPQGQVFFVWFRLADNVARLGVYEPDGTLTLDLDFDEELTLVCTAPDADGNGFWVLGVTVADSAIRELRHYSLPGGVLDTTIEVPTPPGLDPNNMNYFELHTIIDQECELSCGPGNGLTITGVALDVESLAIMSPTGDLPEFDIVSSSPTEIIINNLNPALTAGEWCIAFTPGIRKGNLVFSDGSFIWFQTIDGANLTPPASNPSTPPGSQAAFGGLLSYPYDEGGGYILLDRSEGQHIFDAQFNLTASIPASEVNNLGAGTDYNENYYVLASDNVANIRIQKYNRLTGVLIHEYPTNFFPDLDSVGQIAVSPDNGTAYLITSDSGFSDYNTKIQRYNLAAETGPTVFVTGTNQGGGIDTLSPEFSGHGPGIITLINGDVLAIWNDTTSGDNYIARYNSTGTELNRYPFASGIVPQALTTTLNELSFMVLSGVDGWDHGIVQHIRIADGFVINEFEVPAFEGSKIWADSVFAMVTVWINEWTCCVECGGGPGTPTVTSVDVGEDCTTLTINGTDLEVDDLVIKDPDDNPVGFTVVSSSSTQIVINSLSPAFSSGEWCFGFEIGVYPFCFDLVCEATVSSASANCNEDPITISIHGTNLVGTDLVIKGPDDNPVSFTLLYNTSTLIKVGALSPAFNSGEYCFGFEVGVYPFCFTLTCTPTVTDISANCDEDPITLTITGTALIGADLVIKGPDDLPVTFAIISQSVTSIKIGTLSPEFIPGEYCVGFSPGVYPFCFTVVCTNLLSGIYFLDPTATHDTLYVSFDPVVTTTVKIP